jgi:hypothetical protein
MIAKILAAGAIAGLLASTAIRVFACIAIGSIILELAMFVKWHRGFVIGLLLDWLVVCVLAGVASSIALKLGSR